MNYAPVLKRMINLNFLKNITFEHMTAFNHIPNSVFKRLRKWECSYNDYSFEKVYYILFIHKIIFSSSSTKNIKIGQWKVNKK